MAKKELRVEIGNYEPRGSKLGENFMADMVSYLYLIEYTKDDKSELDVQLRGNYVNIYYQGGNLVKLSGQHGCRLSENYFHRPEDTGLCMTDIDRLCHKDYISKSKESKALKNKTKEELEALREKAIKIKYDITVKRIELIEKLKNSNSPEDVKNVVEEIKKTMRDWKEALVKNKKRKNNVDERVVQHYISLYNKKFDGQTDFVVLDLEYAISTNAIYAKEFEREKQPKIDIIAIEKETGQVYVMELKYGMKSVDGEASAEKHYKDYLATVGHDDKWRSFIKDLEILLKEKQKQNMIGEDIRIKGNKPVFAFIMKQAKDTDESSFREYIENSKDLKNKHIPTIYLPVEKDYSNPSALGHKLSKDSMK